MNELRKAVVQYTSNELRQRVRWSHGLGLLTTERAKDWRQMAYGVLLNRRRRQHDGHKARTHESVAAEARAPEDRA